MEGPKDVLLAWAQPRGYTGQASSYQEPESERLLLQMEHCNNPHYVK